MLAGMLSSWSVLLILSTTFGTGDKRSESTQACLLSIRQELEDTSESFETARGQALTSYMDTHGQVLTPEELALFLDPPEPDLASSQVFKVCCL
jgi:hypothetical protein